MHYLYLFLAGWCARSMLRYTGSSLADYGATLLCIIAMIVFLYLGLT